MLSACHQQTVSTKIQDHKETIPVKTLKLQSSESSYLIQGTGIINSDEQTKCAFKIGGVIERIFVNEGDYFKKGTLLAKLKIDEIDSGVSQAQLSVSKAERDLKRIQNLYRDSVTTLEQVQNAQTLLEVAQKQLKAIEFNRDYANIYAGFDGFVAKKLANEGEIIGDGMPVLIINKAHTSSWIITVGISDKDWANIQLNNRAKIKIDAYPDIEFEGYVSRKLLVAQPNSGSFTIEIKLRPKNHQLALGMFGKAVIETDNKEQFVSIPYDAVIEAHGNSAFVFVPLPNGKVRKQPIQIVSFDDNKVNVGSGLEDIDEIIINNSAFLNENSNVTIIQ